MLKKGSGRSFAITRTHLTPTGKGKGSRRARIIAIAVGLVLAVAVVRLVVPGGARTLGASTALRVLAPAVQVAHPSADFGAADDGAVVAEGDQVKTDAKGHAVINYFDGSTLEIDPSSLVTIGSVEEQDGAQVFSITQAVGRTWSSVKSLTNPRSRYEIKTPTATAAVRGTGFEITVAADGATTIRVSEGTVAVAAQGVEIPVTPGLQTTVAPGAAPVAPVPWTAPRLRVAMRGAAGSSMAVMDSLDRACGFVEPGSLGILAPTPLEVQQIPLCTVTPFSGGVSTVEVGDPTAGTYTIVVFSTGDGGAFTVEASGVLGSTLTFAATAVGDILPGKIRATQISLTVPPDGRLASTNPTAISRIAPVPADQATALTIKPLATLTLVGAPRIALIPLTTEAAAPPGTIALPSTSGIPFLTTLFGAIGTALLLGALLLFGDKLRPLMYGVALTTGIGIITSTLAVLFIYRDWILSLYWYIARNVR